MMKEIKFRAWDKKKLQMITDTKGNYVVSNIGLLKPIEDKFGLIDITQFELMQYTGLKDKNGKEIYEGDILDNPLHWSIRIEYDKGSFMVRDLDKVRYNNLICNIPIGNFDLFDWRIIGNVYENPELLEVKNEERHK